MTCRLRPSISAHELWFRGIPPDGGRRGSIWSGGSGKTCTLKWLTTRKSNGCSVVLERHCDQQLTDGPLTFDDLSFIAVDTVVGFQRPSQTIFSCLASIGREIG